MKRNFLRILDSNEVNSIAEASLAILNETGMVFEHDLARQRLEAEGAIVDHDSKIVRFPRELVESKLKLLKREITYRGRTPEFDRTLSLDSDIYGRVTGGSINYVELKTGLYRRARLDDWREFNRILDALPNICSVSTLHCGDVPRQTVDIHSLHVLLTEQRKCILHNAFSIETQKYIIEMALAAAGGEDKIRQRSQVRLVLSPISPLYMNPDDTEQLMQACNYGIPVDIPIMPICGATGPITIAGTLALANAEYLGVMTLAQTINPGHDMPFFMDPVVANLRSGNALFAAPETAIMIAAISQLGSEVYGMPPEAIGMASDGFTTEQATFQKAQNMFMHVLSGGKLIVGAGGVDSTMAVSPAQLIIDNELIGIARRIVKGMKVDENSLAVEAIKRVGPKGHFLTDDHTIENLHTGELIETDLIERCSRDFWEGGGSKSMRQKASEKGQQILATHVIEPLDDAIQRELQRIVDSADKNLAGINK